MHSTYNTLYPTLINTHQQIESLPSQYVLLPLHFPFDRHLRTFEPLRMKPSSQPKLILFGKVVSDPSSDPFMGIASTPQSFANKVVRTRTP